MAGRLGSIAAAGHLAPATLVGPRRVEEHPAACLIGADPGVLGAAAADGPDQWLGELGQRAVDVIAGEPAGQAQAAGVRFAWRRLKLQERTVAQDAIDFLDRADRRWAALGQGVPKLAECTAGSPDPGQGGLRFLDVSWFQARPLMQPIERRPGCIEVIEGPPPGQAEGVDEVDRRLEVDRG